MSKSIITSDMETCFICGKPKDCIHHCIPGTARRSISDDEGLIVPLCNKCHNMSNNSVHFNHKLEILIRKIAQMKYEETHTRAEWIRRLGRNYLD